MLAPDASADIDVISRLMTSTIVFDCSGARFCDHGIDATEADALMDLLEGLGDRLFFPAQAVEELERLFAGKAHEARKILGNEIAQIDAMHGAVRKRSNLLLDFLVVEHALRESRKAKHAKMLLLRTEYSPQSERLLAIARAHSGPPYDEPRLRQLHGEARQRYDDDVPPGFCDDAAWRSQHGYQHGHAKSPPDSYGDYVFWRQVLDRAIGSNRPVLLVTNDVKRDWYQSDERTGERRVLPALQAEMRSTAGADFAAITFNIFRRLAPKALFRPDATHEAIVVRPNSIRDADFSRPSPRTAPSRALAAAILGDIRKGDYLRRLAAGMPGVLSDAGLRNTIAAQVKEMLDMRVPAALNFNQFSDADLMRRGILPRTSSYVSHDRLSEIARVQIHDVSATLRPGGAFWKMMLNLQKSQRVIVPPPPISALIAKNDFFQQLVASGKTSLVPSSSLAQVLSIGLNLGGLDQIRPAARHTPQRDEESRP